jgi:hypothetical protein
VLNLHVKMSFKNAFFPSWCRYNNFSMPVSLFSFILYTWRKIHMFCEGPGAWLNNRDFIEKVLHAKTTFKTVCARLPDLILCESLIEERVHKLVLALTIGWNQRENYIIERAIESAGKRQNIWLNLHSIHMITYCNFMHYLL